LVLLCRVFCSSGWQSVESAVFESVGGAFESHDVCVVNEPVDHGCGNYVVGEDFAPTTEGHVRVVSTASKINGQGRSRKVGALVIYPAETNCITLKSPKPGDVWDLRTSQIQAIRERRWR
jgi:hypothetical protein